MHSTITVTPAQLPDLLLHVAVVRPVFVWGAPGIGKSTLVREFAASLGLECVTLIGTQLAAEDLIGVPELRDGRSRFAPPEAIARDEPYCLFLDELNASTPEVQKAFYSLILDRRIGDYELPAGSIVIGAGNRSTDNALARPMASALVNRLVHIHLRAGFDDWFAWAQGAGVHRWVVDYLSERPDQLWMEPPKVEETFSTPRSWHMLSDALLSYGDDIDEPTVRLLASGTLTPTHAAGFCGYVKIVRHRYGLDAVVRGDAGWPNAAADRDLLYFLAEAFRARLVKELPASKEHASPTLRQFAHRAKALLVELAEISLECGQAHRLDEQQWSWVLAHCLLHLGFGHLAADRYATDTAYADVACLAVTRFQRATKLGTEPLLLPTDLPTPDEAVLLRQWREAGVPPEYAGCGTGGHGSDLVPPPPHQATAGPTAHDWPAQFALGLASAATAAVEVAGGARSSLTSSGGRREPWNLAMSWFLSSYPLLGALASRFTLVVDAELARVWDISVAAVSASAGEIYLNPLRKLSTMQWRFVLAHEMLHAALRHGDRVGGRDPYLWNVAADYVINGWLIEMGVGDPPDGLLYDPALAGMSAEAVYDQIAKDLRRLRKLATLRGTGLGDVLGEPLPWRGTPGHGVDLDDFYRRALSTGYAYHQREGRGHLPAGLVAEIRVLEQPPLPWDAQLARWFDEYVRSPERTRSYARPSRRQASTPAIPRPGWRWPDELTPRCTFGVVLDTSGSMNHELLGKALGAIASYAAARDVPAARVVFCDAHAYDAGYLTVEQIAGRVRVRGRGGTVLQPGIHLLETAVDFPPTAPILVITDGRCDAVRIRREHAFLIPEGARLPFTPRGPVFSLR